MRPCMTDYAKLTRRLMDEMRLNQAGMADRLRVSQGTVSRWLKGGIVEAPNREKIDDLATEVFGTPKRSPALGEVTVVGFANAGSDGVLFGEGQGPFGSARAPIGATDKTVAVVIRGNSLGPLFNGWVAYYNDRRDTPSSSLDGRMCIVGLLDGRVMLKQLVRASSPKRWHLISNGGDPPITDVVVEWAAPVIDMQPPDSLLP